MIIFYTMAYNAERTLPRTIQSVLDQTESDWIWYLVDNGSQDSTGKIIEQYAAADARIHPLRNEKNGEFTPDTYYVGLACRHDDTDWLCCLDADDAYQADFLERMLAFAAEYDLDVAACGSDFIEAETGKVLRQRILKKNMILTTPKEYDVYFPVYHQFMRTNWGKLFSVRTVRRIDETQMPPIIYGGDTLYTQETLRGAGRFGILAESLHQYSVSRKGRTFQWDPRRFEADKVLYQSACSFLTYKCGAVSDQNRWFMLTSFLRAAGDTVDVIRQSDLSAADKLREYRAVMDDPLTQTAYLAGNSELALNFKQAVLYFALQAGAALRDQEDQDLRAVARYLAPRCGKAVSAAGAKLFLEDREPLDALFQDDAEALLQGLLTRMEQNRAVKKYAIPAMIRALAADHPALCRIDDGVFLRKHTGIYRKVWQGEYIDALDEMTGMLLENKANSGLETFLQLYIFLAAMEDQAPAFIFGKLQLAALYLRQNRKEECRIVANDLIEMGVDDEKLTDICAELDQ